MRSIVKKLSVAIIMVGIIVSVMGCASGKYKKEITSLKQEKWELQQKNTKLEGDVIQWNSRCALLIEELRRSGGYDENEIITTKPITSEEEEILAKKLKSKGLEVISRDGNPAIVISDLFNAGSISLTDSGQKKLKETGKIIKSESPTASIRVDGYTDNTPIQKSVKYESNTALSQARADVVKDFLAKECGLTEANISTRGLGDKNPIADNKTAEGKKKNRRVEIIVIIK